MNENYLLPPIPTGSRRPLLRASRPPRRPSLEGDGLYLRPAAENTCVPRPRPTAIQSLNCTRRPFIRDGRAWLPISPAHAACDRARPLSWGCLARLSARRRYRGSVGGFRHFDGVAPLAPQKSAIEGGCEESGAAALLTSLHTELGGLRVFQARACRPLSTTGRWFD